MELKRHDAFFKVKGVSDAGVFSGYGSIYNVIDDGDDIVAPGCFAESLKASQAADDMPAMLWQHRSAEPCGTYVKVSEDDTGLYVEGQLALKTQVGAEAYELLKMKAIKGLSIGYLTREDSYDQVTGVRTIKRADLWEVSLVTFPMNREARVAAVKSIEGLSRLSDVERYLRDAGGVSRVEAKTLIARIKALALRDAVEADELAQLAESIKAATAVLSR
jgi:HK97 family phage prohead protease